MPNYKNDPTENFETVEELTPIEIFWNTEGEVPEYLEQAIVYLERELKKAKDEIKALKNPKISLTKNDLLQLTQP